MKEQLRLDKYLADMGIGTRSEVKNLIRKSRVRVNGETIRTIDYKISIINDQVSLDNQHIPYIQFEYFMLNKPDGVVSATEDKIHKTVVELIEDSVRKDIFPVGRLDKDTEGLLLLTNDGDLAHRLLSPKKKVGKVYYAKVVGAVTQEDILAFKEGLIIEKGMKLLPAHLKILSVNEDSSEIELTIYEGKFHQVKRMFEAVDKKVIYLKRLQMGSLRLDPNLEVGAYRPLTNIELKELKDLD